MDYLKKFTDGSSNSNELAQGSERQSSQNEQTGNQEQKAGGSSFFGGLGDKLNSAAGGGKESEKNEDYLDKGMIFPL